VRTPKASHFTIDLESPFRLDLSVWAMRRRSVNTIDRWDGTLYQRALVLDDDVVGLSVTQPMLRERRHLDVDFSGHGLGGEAEEDLRAGIESMLGLRVDLSGFYRMAAADRLIARLVARFVGLKPPRFPTVFEGLINAVACQQLSLEAGLSLLNRLTATYGQAVSKDETSLRAFPRADDLVGLESQALRELGFSLRKGVTIIELSRAVAMGHLDLDGLDGLADDEVISQLTSFAGIGRWSAEYVLLRGLGRLHVFPGDDVGARTNLARWLGLERPLDYGGVGQVVSRWQPYAGMIYFHLLIDHLLTTGSLTGPLGAPAPTRWPTPAAVAIDDRTSDGGSADRPSGIEAPRLRCTDAYRDRCGGGSEAGQR
jgi:DNA-3-methyladenine glycosylase II